jgi:hypothetical protein
MVGRNVRNERNVMTVLGGMNHMVNECMKGVYGETFAQRTPDFWVRDILTTYIGHLPLFCALGLPGTTLGGLMARPNRALYLA